MKPILTITGSDPTGESGVQADTRTIAELGGHAASAITSITVQTTLGIQEFYDLPGKVVQRQVEAVMNDLQPDVVKVGLIRTADVLDVVVDTLQRYRPRHIIYDAVVQSTHGDALLPAELLADIRARLLPLCTLVLRLDAAQMHGLANRYASAVAVFLSRGETPEQAQADARTYINTQIVRSGDLQGRSSELYNEFLDMLAEHHREASDVHYYADRLNVSSRYLAQVARRIAGKSPKAIIDEYLMRQIELQLKNTDRTVQEVAYHFGFSSQAHFTKFFKKATGMTPTQYRRQ